MDLKLKSIKHVPSMSQETECFHANLWLGNKKVAYVENRGFGGPTDVSAYNGMKDTLKEIEEYCKNLPPIKTNLGHGEFELDNDLELVVDNLLQDWIRNKDFKKGIVFKDKNGIEKLMTWKNGWTVTKLLKVKNGRASIKKVVDRIKAEGGEVLNTNLGELV